MEASDTGVKLSDGSLIEAHIVSVATPVRPPQWIQASGLADSSEFLSVTLSYRFRVVMACMPRVILSISRRHGAARVSWP